MDIFILDPSLFDLQVISLGWSCGILGHQTLPLSIHSKCYYFYCYLSFFSFSNNLRKTLFFKTLYKDKRLHMSNTSGGETVGSRYLQQQEAKCYHSSISSLLNEQPVCWGSSQELRWRRNKLTSNPKGCYFHWSQPPLITAVNSRARPSLSISIKIRSQRYSLTWWPTKWNWSVIKDK